MARKKKKSTKKTAQAARKRRVDAVSAKVAQPVDKKAAPVQPSAQEAVKHAASQNQALQATTLDAITRVAATKSLFSPWLQAMFFLVLAAVIATPALVGPYGQSGGYTPDLHMAAYIQVLAFLLLTILALVYIRSKADHFDVIRSPIILPAFLFYLYAMASVFWASTKYDAMIDALDWTGAFAAGFLILLLVRDYVSMYWLTAIVFISGVLIALFGIGQYLFGLDWVQQHVVPAATFSNKNMAGQYGVLTFPLAVILFFQAKKNLAIWAGAIGSALIAGFIYYVRARGSWVAALTEVFLLLLILSYVRWAKGVVLFAGWQKKAAAVVFLLLSFSFFVLTPEIIREPEKAIESYTIEESNRWLMEGSGLSEAKKVYAGASFSASKRLTIWLNSIPMVVDHFFFGTGIGNWRVYYPTYQEWFWPDWELHRNLYHANAHNDYVEIVSEFGLFGSILFFWLVVAFFRTWFYVIRRVAEENFVVLGPVVAALGISTSAIFSFPLKQPVPALFIISYMALISCCYSFLQTTDKKAFYKIPYKNVAVRSFVAATLFITTTSLLVLHYNLYHAELNYRTSVSSLRTGQYNNSRQAAIVAQQHSPLRSELRWLEATSQLRLNDVKGAVENYKIVLADYPNSPNTLNNLATAYSMAGNTLASVETYQQLVQAQPSNMKLKGNYAIMLLRLGYYDQALPYLDESLAYYEGNLARSTDWWLEQEAMMRAAGQEIRKPVLLINLERKVLNMQTWKERLEKRKARLSSSKKSEDEKPQDQAEEQP